MKEIDPKYNELLKQTYPDLVVDYVLLENADEYKAEQSHKEAVKHALSILSKRKGREVPFTPTLVIVLRYSHPEASKTENNSSRIISGLRKSSHLTSRS